MPFSCPLGVGQSCGIRLRTRSAVTLEDDSLARDDEAIDVFWNLHPEQLQRAILESAALDTAQVRMRHGVRIVAGESITTIDCGELPEIDELIQNFVDGSEGQCRKLVTECLVELFSCRMARGALEHSEQEEALRSYFATGSSQAFNQIRYALHITSFPRIIIYSWKLFVKSKARDIVNPLLHVGQRARV